MHTHTHAHYENAITYSLLEAGCDIVLRSLADRLSKEGMGRSVIQLQGLDATEIVCITSGLVVSGIFREGAFGEEFVGLIVQVVNKVVS